MKKLMNYFAMMLLIGGVAFVSSCGTDDPDPIDPIVDPVDSTKTYLLADGFYIANTTTDPTKANVLISESVEAPSFGSQDRSGFLANYVYLTAGDYNVIQIVNKKATATLGGVVEQIVDSASLCDKGESYMLIDVASDSTAFAVASEGIYKVSYDASTAEVILYKLTSVGIIGSATPTGWGGDTNLEGTVSVTADGASWVQEGITLREGEFKIRFNCRWGIDRRIDPTIEGDAVFDASNAYLMFTNFGGSVTELLTGNDGSNIGVSAVGGDAPDEAVYTVTASWTADAGFAVALERTGEAEVIVAPTFPDVMYLVGAGTAYGWANPGVDTHVEYVPGAEMHKIAGDNNEGIYWKILHIEAGQGFKISALDWAAPNLGHADVTAFDVDGVTVTDNGGNMDIATSGMYMVVLNLQNDEFNVSIITPEVYGMGDGAFGGWVEDNSANLFTIDNTAKTLTSPALSGTGGIRSYVNHAWIPAWWNAEFVPNAGAIEYRNDGGDPSAQTAAVGNTITYTFDNNTATIQ